MARGGRWLIQWRRGCLNFMAISLAERLRGKGRAPGGVRLRRFDAARWVEFTLCAILAVQVARLFWVLITPVGLFGIWNARVPAVPGAAERMALLSTFDPFFRSAQPSGGGNVTSLALKLFGTRLNEGAGGGSAIIAGADGVQASYAVGDEIMPGVILKGVAFDHVVIDRGGAQESLFIDQSGAVPDSAPVPGGVPSTTAAAGSAINAASVQSDIAFAPRVQGNRMTGISVGPKGSGGAFAAGGFQNGDVITAINGTPVASASDMQSLQSMIAPGARLSLQVERGGGNVTLALNLGGQ